MMVQVPTDPHRAQPLDGRAYPGLHSHCAATDGRMVRPEGFEPPTPGSEVRCSCPSSCERMGDDM